MSERILDQNTLREILDYDPESGVFTWRNREDLGPWWNDKFAGKRAGCLWNGYTGIRVNGRNYRAHRLAWLHVHGIWPAGQLDHINRDKQDNRIVNLREATASQNKANTEAYLKNPSGLKGVFRLKSNGRFLAQISVNGKTQYLGRYNDPVDAALAYDMAARRLHGDFAMLNFPDRA